MPLQCYEYYILFTKVYKFADIYESKQMRKKY